jgi:hypothetical protein
VPQAPHATREPLDISVLRSLASARLPPGELLAHLIDQAGRAEQQHRVAGAEPELRVGQPIGSPVPHRHEVHAGGKACDHFGHRDAVPLGGEHHRPRPAGRCRRDARLNHSREHEDDRIGPMMPIGYATE